MRLAYYLAILLVIGLIASLSSPGKLVEVQYTVHYGMPSMYNVEWNGTSILAEALSKEGYRVVEAYTRIDPLILAAMYNPDRIIYVYIAPRTPLGIDDVRTMEYLEENYRVSLLVCDEANTSNRLLSRYGLSVSGRIIYTSYGSPYPIAYFSFNGFKGLYVLNYASSIGYTGNVAVIARTIDGDIVGVVAKKDDDMIAVISDSSLFINLMMSKSTIYMNYTKLALELFNYLSRGTPPNKTLVIIDLTHYNPPPLKKIAEITGKSYVVLHPLILVQLASTYMLYVEEVAKGIENIWLIMTYALASLIVLVVLYNLLRP